MCANVPGVEIVEGVHRIGPDRHGYTQGGYSQAYLFDDGGGSLVLVDTGYAEDAGEILKYLWAIGRSPNELTDIAITHAHRSHLGGLAALKRLAPRATVHAHVWESDIIDGGRKSQPIPLAPLFPLKLYPLRLLQLIGRPKHVPCPVDHHVVEAVVRAVVCRPGARQRGPKGAQGVVRLLAPACETGAEEVELRLERPDPDSEHQPSAGDLVEGAVPLRDLEGMVVAEDQDAGGESNGVGHRREESERRERVPVATAAGLGDGAGDGDVLGAREVVEAETVGRLGDPDDVLPRRVPLPWCVGVGDQGDDGGDETEAHQREPHLAPTPSRVARRTRSRPA